MMGGNRLLAAILLLSAAFGRGAFAQELTYPPKPGNRDFIVDEAKLITERDAATIKAVCNKLLDEKGVPIVVVTINSMAQYGAKGWNIIVYAQNLFSEWGIGYKEWNYGMLLLVSKGDRKARIELGREWQFKKDAQCQQVMDTLIIPNFKNAKFSEGILAGVQGLNAMARELKLPSPPKPWWYYPAIVGFFALMIFTGVSLFQNGSSGWAWVLWGVVFGIIGVVLYSFLRAAASGGGGGSSSSGGGSYSGGSAFGGGSSGGGGATGSW